MILASATPYQPDPVGFGRQRLRLGRAARHPYVGSTAARNWVVIAWVLHGAVLAWSLMGSTAYFGFAPALSVTAWLVAAVYAVESQVFPQLQTRWALAALGALAVALAFVFPGSPLASHRLHLASAAPAVWSGLLPVCLAPRWYTRGL